MTRGRARVDLERYRTLETILRLKGRLEGLAVRPSARTLAEEFQVTRRTIFRYLLVLRRVGVTVPPVATAPIVAVSTPAPTEAAA